MLKCPVCGNVEFHDREAKADFICPVAGCGGLIRVVRPEGSIAAWSRPTGGNLSWADSAAGEGKEDSGEDPEAQTLLIREGNDGEAEVFGVRKKDAETLEIPSFWKGRSVVRIAPAALKGMKALKRVKLPDGLKTIGSEGFALCEALECVEFGENVELIDSFAFRGCARLSQLSISVPPVCVMDTAFAGCYALGQDEKNKLTDA